MLTGSSSSAMAGAGVTRCGPSVWLCHSSHLLAGSQWDIVPVGPSKSLRSRLLTEQCQCHFVERTWPVVMLMRPYGHFNKVFLVFQGCSCWNSYLSVCLYGNSNDLYKNIRFTEFNLFNQDERVSDTVHCWFRLFHWIVEEEGNFDIEGRKTRSKANVWWGRHCNVGVSDDNLAGGKNPGAWSPGDKLRLLHHLTKDQPSPLALRTFLSKYDFY